MMTPYEMRIVLHAASAGSLDDFPHPNALAYRPAIERLREQDLLTPQDELGLVRPTARAKALVSLWCQCELPRQAWVDPRTGDVI